METHTYTPTGAKRTESNDTLTATYTYDAQGRVTKVEETGNIVKNYTYNLDNSRASGTIKVKNVLTNNTTYAYDVLGRMTSVSEGGVLQATYTYDANGNRQSLTYANGVEATYTYNRANLLTNLTNKLGSTTLSSYAYTYKLDGNQTSKQDHTGRLTTYAYDGFGRLSEEKEVKSGVTEFSLNYTYDSFGNRISMEDKDGGLTQYSYNKKNQLLQTVEESDGDVSTSDYIYDGNGNQLIKTTTILKEADSELNEETLISLNTPYAEVNTYDPYNRLTESIAANETVQYSYRPDGLRNSKSANGVTTTHLWDGANIVGDLQNGALQSTYVRGIGLIASKDTTGVHSYYLQNGHGDVIQLADSNGLVTKLYDYDAFGVERDMDAQDVNPFRYCGEYFDRETETIYLRARYYNPRTGRFTAEDPAQAELNWYTYCSNSPVIMVDPWGLEGVLIREIMEKNGGEVTQVKTNILGGVTSVTVKMGDTEKTYKVGTDITIINKKSVIDNSVLMRDFDLSEKASTHQAGDYDFSREEDAALAFGLKYNNKSKSGGEEYGASINESSDGKYSFANVVHSKAQDHGNVHQVNIPCNSNTVAIVHIHWGNSEPRGSYSDPEDYVAVDTYGLNAYLINIKSELLVVKPNGSGGHTKSKKLGKIKK